MMMKCLFSLSVICLLSALDGWAIHEKSFAGNDEMVSVHHYFQEAAPPGFRMSGDSLGNPSNNGFANTAYIITEGSLFICPGDTITLIVQTSRPYTFNNAGVVQSNANADTIRVNMPGTYIAEYIRTDSVTGCSKEYTAIFVLPLTAVPEITAFPASGLICPGDSVLLVADSGFSYIWFWPSGTPLSTNDSLWTSTPGLYYYTFENTEGCLLSSAPFDVFCYLPIIYVTDSSMK